VSRFKARFSQPRSLAALGLLTASLLAAAPSSADWLVTREGGQLETKGPWKVDGKRVVFTLPNGTLSSLRLTEVDLEGSRKATVAELEATSEAEKPQAPPSPKKSVRVFTDKDFTRVDPPAAAADPKAAAAQAPGAVPAAPETPSPVQVVDWKQESKPGADKVEVFGTVRNTGQDVATAVNLTVRLFDEQGGLLALEEASLTTRALQPGQTTSFRAVFPGIISFGSTKFEIRSVPLMINPKAGDEPPGGATP
jgi:hypothetical protein